MDCVRPGDFTSGCFYAQPLSRKPCTTMISLIPDTSLEHSADKAIFTYSVGKRNLPPHQFRKQANIERNQTESERNCPRTTIHLVASTG
eukprot:5412015-Amphidinium_carterae.1